MDGQVGWFVEEGEFLFWLAQGLVQVLLQTAGLSFYRVPLFGSRWWWWWWCEMVAGSEIVDPLKA